MLENAKKKMLGISIKNSIGIGDGLQFSSLPENYFAATGRKLVDVSRPWFFDANPYVDRATDLPERLVREMWNFNPMQYQWPRPRSGATKAQVYLSNAEIWAAVWGVPVVLNRPRLYRFENRPFESRQLILLHTHGRSHGAMPENIIQHVIEKYQGTGNLIHVGHPETPYIGVPQQPTTTLWQLAELVSQARMFIGVDSGPSWIAACYPDVILKRVRTRPVEKYFREWVPLEIDNVHAHWDDRCAQIYNISDNDIGFTQSYKRI